MAVMCISRDMFSVATLRGNRFHLKISVYFTDLYNFSQQHNCGSSGKTGWTGYLHGCIKS